MRPARLGVVLYGRVTVTGQLAWSGNRLRHEIAALGTGRPAALTVAKWGSTTGPRSVGASLYDVAVQSVRIKEHLSRTSRVHSFDFDNNEKQKNLFVGQAKSDSPTPFMVHDWSSKTKLSRPEWEKLIKQKMASTTMCIVLVGRSRATATRVTKEIAMAKALNVAVFGVYLDGAGPSSTLPTGLQRNRTIAWDWKLISAAVKQMMGEGRNAGRCEARAPCWHRRLPHRQLADGVRRRRHRPERPFIWRGTRMEPPTGAPSL